MLVCDVLISILNASFGAWVTSMVRCVGIFMLSNYYTHNAPKLNKSVVKQLAMIHCCQSMSMKHVYKLRLHICRALNCNEGVVIIKKFTQLIIQKTDLVVSLPVL